MTEPETMGSRVCRARKHRQLTQRQLAEKAVVSDGYISMLETGDHIKSFGLIKVMAIADALAVPLDWVVNGGPDPWLSPSDTQPVPFRPGDTEDGFGPSHTPEPDFVSDPSSPEANDAA